MKTNEILQITPEDFEMLQYDAFLKYCQSKTNGNQEQLQMLVSSNAIYNWWVDQCELHEDNFHTAALPFIGKMTSESAIQLFMDHMESVERYFSKTLIKEALNESA